jgi:hypothetical protein
MVTDEVQLSVLFFRFSGSRKEDIRFWTEISEYSTNLLILIYSWMKFQFIVNCQILNDITSRICVIIIIIIIKLLFFSEETYECTSFSQHLLP